MNSSTPEQPESAPRQRLRFELIFASIWLAIGLFLLPACIYLVGVLLLGPYGEGAGLGTFYANFFGDLVEPAGRAWIIALAPLFLVSIVRLIFIGVDRPTDETPTKEEVEEKDDSPPREHSRVEPRVSME